MTLSTTVVRDGATILSEAADSFRHVTETAGLVDAAADAVSKSLASGGKVMFCGNGGSAADAQHLAAEFLGRFLLERSPWAALALSTNSSAVTAIGNDYGYEHVFSRQLRGLGRSGDVLFGITTSGRSANVINAFAAARELGVFTISLTGAAESPLSEMADLAIRAPSRQTPRIQEMHIAIGHAICELVEISLAGRLD